MPKVLIAYASRTGQTQNIAELIAEGVRFTGVEAKVLDAKALPNAEDFAGYDAYVFGSATYHGEMMQAMKTLLFLAAQVNLEGKVGGSFGSYGWSGEAADRIYDTMQRRYWVRLKRLRCGGAPDGGITVAIGNKIGGNEPRRAWPLYWLFKRVNDWVSLRGHAKIN
jgi:flavorubredoxin